MDFLTGKNIYLRALEPEDLEFIYEIENDATLWEVSHTQTPYSRFLIRQYLENAHQDIYEAKQLRLVICDVEEDKALGLIDLFDFDPQHRRAGLGIVVKRQEDRAKGIGAEAVDLMIHYVFRKLHLQVLYVNISTDNYASQALFEKFNFELIGVKKAWNQVGNQRKDEALYQLINTTL